MATLQFNKLQPIGFGDKEVTPEVTTEKKLRLQSAKGDTEEGLKQMVELIASCFGEEAEYVKEFIDKNLTLVDIFKVQAYLIGGEKLAASVDKNLENALDTTEATNETA